MKHRLLLEGVMITAQWLQNSVAGRRQLAHAVLLQSTGTLWTRRAVKTHRCLIKEHPRECYHPFLSFLSSSLQADTALGHRQIQNRPDNLVVQFSAVVFIKRQHNPFSHPNTPLRYQQPCNTTMRRITVCLHP